MDNHIATVQSATELDKFWVNFVIGAGILGVLLAYGFIAWAVHQFAGGIGTAVFIALVVLAVCFISAARKYGRRHRD